MLKTSQDRRTREYGTSEGKTPKWGKPLNNFSYYSNQMYNRERERERDDRNIIDLPR